MATTKVKLYSAELDETREHDLEHANNIFAYKHDHGWQLKDENFTLNNNGIIVQRSSGKGAKTNKPGTTEHSGTA